MFRLWPNSCRAYEASIFVGIAAPRGTPAEIIGTLSREINLALADRKNDVADRRAWRHAAGAVDSEFERLIAEETEKWGNVIRSAKLRAE